MTTDHQIIRQLEDEWCRVLDVPTAHDGDDFFDLGGDSLSAVRLIQSVEERTSAQFPLEVLFLDGTLGGLKQAGWTGKQT